MYGGFLIGLRETAVVVFAEPTQIHVGVNLVANCSCFLISSDSLTDPTSPPPPPRYANHKGGKKYEKSSLTLERERAAQTGEGGEVGNPNHSTLPQRTELPRSMGHAGQEEKLAASEIFKAAWRECTSDGAYLALKAEWQREKKEWLRAGGGSRRVKTETDDIDGSEVTTEPRKEPSIKVEGDDG